WCRFRTIPQPRAPQQSPRICVASTPAMSLNPPALLTPQSLRPQSLAPTSPRKPRPLSPLRAIHTQNRRARRIASRWALKRATTARSTLLLPFRILRAALTAIPRACHRHLAFPDLRALLDPEQPERVLLERAPQAEARLVGARPAATTRKRAGRHSERAFQQLQHNGRRRHPRLQNVTR